jgi:hypothetical protein
MVLAHDEEEDRALEPLGLVEFELSDRDLLWVAISVLGDLAVFQADEENVGGAVPHHLE